MKIIFLFSFFVFFNCNNKYKENKEKSKKIKSLYVENNFAFIEAKQRQDEKEIQKIIKQFGKIYNYAFVALEKKYQALLYLAQLHVEKKQFYQAIKVFEKINILYPHKKKNTLEMGMCYIHLYENTIHKKKKQEYFLTAEKIFKKEIKLFSKESGFYYGLGFLYGIQGKNNNNNLFLKKGIDKLSFVKPNSKYYFLSLFSTAHFLILLEKKSKAIELYEKIVTKTDKNSKLHQQALNNIKKLNN